MEGAEPSTGVGTTTGQHGKPEADGQVLLSSKPLHRFVKQEPRCLGIVIVMFGCAELLMGFPMASESVINSCRIYIPFWQGALGPGSWRVLDRDLWMLFLESAGATLPLYEEFIVCGNLSIYTEIHPSKKMVTVCLAMYVVSLLGTIVSIGFRMFCFRYLTLVSLYGMETHVDHIHFLLCVEGLLFTSSLCVVVLLIFLSAIARLALKSTQSQVIVQCIPMPAQSATTST